MEPPFKSRSGSGSDSAVPDPSSANAIISMIPIGTHSLWTSLSNPGEDERPRPPAPPVLSVSGDPDSNSKSKSNPKEEGDSPPQNPLVVIIPGAGDVASSYVALERLLRPSARILLYDRTGLGRSEKRPSPPSDSNSNEITGPVAVRAATELHTLLHTLNERGPYILLAHSYGGIVAREFLELHPHPEDGVVAGMVLVDCATERSAELFPDFPDPNVVAVMGDLNFARVTGLRADTVLSDEEWRARARDIYAGAQGAAMEEAGSFVEVCATLRGKEQVRNVALGDRPLVVVRANGVRDYERIYEAGVKVGNGSVEQQRAFRDLLDRWEGVDAEVQEGQLGLSRVSRYVRVEDVGHNVHLVRPGVIVDAVRWVMERVVPQSVGCSS
ncbi:alpha/beta hydrolase [Aspergillus ustus]|uniref:Alpha/beta hydrolase n=1 Tax=Aspergillus ustus TaxID=40382 RepID=A0A0C1E2V3_ASPUT|nr:alpha/beta hydrolase [Aspergillus ustus]